MNCRKILGLTIYYVKRKTAILAHFFQFWSTFTFILLPATSPSTLGLVVVYQALSYLLLNSLPFLHWVNNLIQFFQPQVLVRNSQTVTESVNSSKSQLRLLHNSYSYMAISFPAKAKATFYQVRSKTLKTQYFYYVGDFGVENMTNVFQQKIKILAT